MEHVQYSSRTSEGPSWGTNNTLTFAESGLIHGGENERLRDCDGHHGCIRDNIHPDNELQKAFADSSLGPALSRRLSVVFVREDDQSYWFAQVGLLFYVKSDAFGKSREKLAFVQYFGVTPPVNEIDKKLNCLISQKKKTMK